MPMTPAVRIFGILPFIVTAGYASEAVQCNVQFVARCICPASMSVACANGLYSGNILDEEKQQSVTMTVTLKDGSKREATIKSPSLGIRSYYGGGGRQAFPELAKALGVPAEQIAGASLTSFTAPTDLQLYQDHNGKEKVASPLVRKGDATFGQCRFVDKSAPSLPIEQTEVTAFAAVDRACLQDQLKKPAFQGGAVAADLERICFGNVFCPKDGKVELVICEGVSDGRCPAAADCRSQFLAEAKKSGGADAEIPSGDRGFSGKPVLFKGVCVGNFASEDGFGATVALGKTCKSALITEDKCLNAVNAKQILPATSSARGSGASGSGANAGAAQ